VNDFFKGMHYFATGFKLILQPGLKRFIILPLIINISLFAALLLGSSYLFNEFNHWILTFLPSWLQWLGNILWIIFFIGFFLFILFSFVILANLIAAPFNSILAEKVAVHLTGKIPLEQSLTKEITRSIRRQWDIIKYYVPRACVLFLLFFIPLIQIFSPLLSFSFNAWCMALQYIDYPTDNAHLAFATVRRELQQKKSLTFGFGLILLLLTMIPLINCIVMPAAVAGATALWIKEFECDDV
jgi:CysZ protein